jgi:hypothetical protein
LIPRVSDEGNVSHYSKDISELNMSVDVTVIDGEKVIFTASEIGRDLTFMSYGSFGNSRSVQLILKIQGIAAFITCRK